MGDSYRANVDDKARVAHLKELEAEMTATPDRKLVIEFKLVAKTFKVFVGNDRQLQRYLAEHSEPAAAQLACRRALRRGEHHDG